MIFGIGTDILRVDRIEKTYAKFATRFVNHLLMPEEHAQLLRTARPVRFLAMRFAAKEAIVKAMGTGFAHGVWIRDVGIVQNAWGKPEVIYSARGEIVRSAAHLLTPGKRTRVECSTLVVICQVYRPSRPISHCPPRDMQSGDIC